jgi:hypothetical protein
MPWIIEEREFTTWCELLTEDGLLWLEWNDRVFAYRCGLSKKGLAGQSHLGYADSLEAAQNIALELLILQSP